MGVEGKQVFPKNKALFLRALRIKAWAVSNDASYGFCDCLADGALLGWIV